MLQRLTSFVTTFVGWLRYNMVMKPPPHHHHQERECVKVHAKINERKPAQFMVLVVDFE